MEVRIADCPLGAKCEEVKEIEGRQVMFRCPWFKQLRGKHPQTGQEIDEWDCAVGWLPVLQIEVAKEVRQGAAATESFRNNMLELNKGVPAEVIEAKAQMKALGNGS